MNSEQVKEIAAGVVPAMVAAVIACALIVLKRKGKPIGDRRAEWVGVLMLGLGCAAGAAWAGGAWKPGASATTWLPAMALLAGATGLSRGGAERAGVIRRLVVAAALMAATWMTVRSVDGMSLTVRLAVIAGIALAGSVACWGMERSVREQNPQPHRGGWPAAATGLIVAFGASQVLIIGMEVHAAAWVAAGVSAFFGVCLAVGVVTRRPLVGRGVLAAASVLLCGLLVHGWRLGNSGRVESAVYGALLLVGAIGPVVSARVLGERRRGWAGWGGLITCGVPVMAAVVTAAILRPPPLD